MHITSCLRWVFAATLVGLLGGQSTQAAGLQAKQNSARPISPSPNTPFEAVIGSHLADWVKQGRQAAESVPQGRQAASVAASSVRVNAPAFVAPPFLAFGAALVNPLAADFNNDGKVDFANVEGDGTIMVLLNPGSFSNLAALQPLGPNTSATAGGKGRNIVQALVADMDGDGNADLIALDTANSSVVVWHGNGDGTFGNATDYSIAAASGAAPEAIVIADFNGDGKPDVATVDLTPATPNATTSTITELTLLNQGGGVLAPGKEVDTTVNEAFGMWTGAADVISQGGKPTGLAFVLTDSGYTSPSGPGSYVFVLSSNGDGSFTAAVKPGAPLISSESPITIIATNLISGSAGSQMAQAKRSHRALLSSNSSTGAAISTTDLVISAGNGALYDVPYAGGSGNPASAIALVGTPDNLSATSGLFPSSPGAFPLIPNTGLVVADFDGDGFLDLLTTTAATAYVFPNSGNRTFSRAPVQVSGASAGNVVAADFDNSGYPSLIWADDVLSQIGYFQNLGSTNPSQSGLFYAAPAVSGPSTNGGSDYYAFGANIGVQAVADVNGDGLEDVIATDSSYVYRDGLPVHLNADIVLGINNGAGIGNNESNGFTFSTVISGISLGALGFNPLLEPVAIKTTAGTTVLLTIASPPALYTIAIDNKGNAGAPQALNFGSVTPACTVYYADAGDVNGDGNADIVVAYSGDFLCTGGTPGQGAVNSGFFTFLGNGDGTFQAGQYTPVGTALFKVKLIDLTGAPGKLDVVAIDSYTPASQQPGPIGPGGPSSAPPSHHTYVIPGNGDGTFQASAAADAAPNYIVSDIISGDFNQDGIQDLILTTEGQYNSATQGMIANTSGVLLLPGNGDRTFGAGQLIDQGFYPATGKLGDFNGDGTPDLAVTQFTSSNALIPFTPILEVFPNLGGGVFGPSYGEFQAPFNWVLESGLKTVNIPLFTGAFGAVGSTDLLLSNGYNSTLFLNQGQPALQVTAAPTTVSQGAPVTLTAALLLGGNTVSSATGAVTFSINGTALGSSPLENGTATFITSNLPAGSDVVNAAYSGDANNNPATGSATVTVTALAPAFTMTASPGSLSLVPGATGTATLALTSNAAFSGAISFTCTGAPSEASCTVVPSTLTISANQTGNVAVVVATTATNNQYQGAVHLLWKTAAAGGVSLAGVLLLLLPRRRRYAGIWSALALILLAGGCTGLLTGCGSDGGNKYPGTPMGTSTLTITATAGTLSVSQTITVNIGQAQQ